MGITGDAACPYCGGVFRVPSGEQPAPPPRFRQPPPRPAPPKPQPQQSSAAVDDGANDEIIRDVLAALRRLPLALQVYAGQQAFLGVSFLALILGLLLSGAGHPALLLGLPLLLLIAHLPCWGLSRLAAGEWELRSASRFLFFGIWLGGSFALALAGAVAEVTAALLRPASLMGVLLAVFMGGCCLSPLWLGFGHWPAWWLATRIAATFISTLQCPRCGFETDAVACWSSGGYNAPFEQHILLFRNPLNGGRIGHLDCPACEATILL